MSTEFLYKLLDEQIKGFDRLNEEARKELATHTHKLNISQGSLQREILSQIPNRGELSTEGQRKLEALAKEYAKKIAQKVYSQYNKPFYDEWTKVTGNLANFSVVMEGKASGGRVGNVFRSFQKSIKAPKNELVNKINVVLKNEEKQEIDKGNFLDLGHKGATAVANFRGNETKFRISEKIREKGISEKELSDLGFTMSLTKKDSKQKTEFELGFEGANRNRSEGATKLKKRTNRTKAQLEKLVEAINKKENWAEREGSDSRKTIEEKKIIASFEDNIKEGKNLKKLTKNNTKPKYSNKTVKKTRKKKTKKGIAKRGSIGVITPKVAKTQAAQSAVSLLALLNQKITQTVAGNMNYPALRYRTGRFARSVKITDIALTARGYPSIGYTYMKRPYQTFEPGYRQGSKDRDPRRLIDNSIREIAANLLIGRFYTRRV